MNTIKLIKETNSSGQIFYSVEINDQYVSHSVIYGGSINHSQAELEEKYQEALNKYNEILTTQKEMRFIEKSRVVAIEDTYE